MVRLQTLDLPIEVRILAPEQAALTNVAGRKATAIRETGLGKVWWRRMAAAERQRKVRAAQSGVPRVSGGRAVAGPDSPYRHPPREGESNSDQCHESGVKRAILLAAISDQTAASKDVRGGSPSRSKVRAATEVTR
jgi:hypothetical protein